MKLQILLKMCILYCVCSSLPALYDFIVSVAVFQPCMASTVSSLFLLFCFATPANFPIFFTRLLFPPLFLNCCSYFHAVVPPVLHWWGPLYSGALRCLVSKTFFSLVGARAKETGTLYVCHFYFRQIGFSVRWPCSHTLVFSCHKNSLYYHFD